MRGLGRLGLVLLGLVALVVAAWFALGLDDWRRDVQEVQAYRRSVAETEHAPTPPLVANVFARERISLDGTWQALIDPLRAQTNLLGLIQRDVRPSSPADLVEPSFEGGLTLRVPGDWNSQDPRLFFYRGGVWYARRFDAPVRPDRRAFLHFGAANYRAEVYLNGRRFGVHEGGFTPFNVEVSGALRAEGNWLVVRVDNETGPEDVPTPETDWLNHGGLTREVSLLWLPRTFVRDYALGLGPEAGSLAGWVQLDGPDRAGAEVAVAIPGLGVSVRARADAEGRATWDATAEPALWSPAAPTRYAVEIRGGGDAVADEVGFRRVETRGDEILVNGEPVFLRGISIHEEAPEGGRAWSPEHAEALLGWARDLGCNFVRLAHYPHNEHMLRAADRLGLFVWGEIPVYWNIAFESPRTLARAKRQLSEMIARDRNRAAILFWSIGNETPITPARNDFMRRLADHVRSEDPSRLVTAALLTGREVLEPLLIRSVLPALVGVPRSSWVLRVDDPLGDIVDVPALNEYLGWYYATPLAMLTPFGSHKVRKTILDHLDRVRIETGTGKPLVISEFGAGAVAGRHAPEAELAVFSEEYQALVYRRQLAMIERQPDVRGISPWVLKDFRSAMRLHSGLQDYWNRKGLVSDDGRRKQAFDVLRDWYRRRAEND